MSAQEKTLVDKLSDSRAKMDSISFSEDEARRTESMKQQLFKDEMVQKEEVQRHFVLHQDFLRQQESVRAFEEQQRIAQEQFAAQQFFQQQQADKARNMSDDEGPARRQRYEYRHVPAQDHLQSYNHNRDENLSPERKAILEATRQRENEKQQFVEEHKDFVKTNSLSPEMQANMNAYRESAELGARMKSGVTEEQWLSQRAQEHDRHLDRNGVNAYMRQHRDPGVTEVDQAVQKERQGNWKQFDEREASAPADAPSQSEARTSFRKGSPSFLDASANRHESGSPQTQNDKKTEKETERSSGDPKKPSEDPEKATSGLGSPPEKDSFKKGSPSFLDAAAGKHADGKDSGKGAEKGDKTSKKSSESLDSPSSKPSPPSPPPQPQPQRKVTYTIPQVSR